MERFIKALERFDSLKTVIEELRNYDGDEVIPEEIIEYLNDEADYMGGNVKK